MNKKLIVVFVTVLSILLTLCSCQNTKNAVRLNNHEKLEIVICNNGFEFYFSLTDSLKLQSGMIDSEHCYDWVERKMADPSIDAPESLHKKSVRKFPLDNMESLNERLRNLEKEDEQFSQYGDSMKKATDDWKSTEVFVWIDNKGYYMPESGLNNYLLYNVAKEVIQVSSFSNYLDIFF